MDLRDYQQEAVDAVFAYWDRAPSTSSRPASPLVVMPTGSGKSPTLGALTRRLVEEYGARVVIATHRAELIEQDARAIRSMWPQAPIGIYSAGLALRQVDRITVCGIQSIRSRPDILGHVDVMIIDEAHLISPDDGTSYQRVIGALRERNPDMRCVGLTATPYRLGQGYLTEGDDAIFSAVAYDVDVKRLIRDGWLSPVVTGYVTTQIDVSNVATRMGEFAARDLELACDVDSINGKVADDVADALKAGRTSAMIFGTSVAHAARLRNEVQMRGLSCEIITGETDRGARDAIIGRFKRRELAVLSSCDVLTTGFDAPVVDVIALVRPTMSPSLYVQMVGRGMRLADRKGDCLLLDYGGNIARHGPIDEVRVRPRGRKGEGDAPVKTCPTCCAQCATSARVCDHCGHEFPPPERKANDRASNLPALSVVVPLEPPTEHAVGRVEWAEHTKAGDDEAPTTLRIDYYPPEDSPISFSRKIASEWVCLNHDGGSFAHRKAERWWVEHTTARMADDVKDAISLLDAGYLRPVVAIRTQPDPKNKKWIRVVEVIHGEARQVGDDDDAEEGAISVPPEPIPLAANDEMDDLPW